MANVETAQLHDFVNGETVDEAKLDQNFEVLRIAGNDTNTKVNAISANGAIGTSNIADGAVTTPKITDANVTTAKLADGSVTVAKLADNSVTGAKIVDATITNAEIATGTITQDKLVTGTLDNRYYTETEVDTKLALKANLASPTFTGTVTVPAPVNGTDATTKTYVDTADGTKVSKSGDTMTGALTLSGNPTVNNHAANKAYVDTQDAARVAKTGDTMTGSLTLPGNPTSNLEAAPKQYVDQQIANLISSAPGVLDTLDEIAAALGDDPNFATTMTNQLATKAPLASPALTGTPTAPTAVSGTNTTQLATTAFVQTAVNNLPAGSVNTADLADGAVTAAKLDPAIATGVGLGVLQTQVDGIQNSLSVPTYTTTSLIKGTQLVTATQAGSATPTIFGKTLVNILGNDGGCESTTPFTTVGTVATSTTQVKTGTNSIKVVASASISQFYKDFSYKLDTTKQYLVGAWVYIESYTSGVPRIRISDYQLTTLRYETAFSTSNVGFWQFVYIKIPTSNTVQGNGFRLAIQSGGASDTQTFYIDSIRLYEVDSTTYNAIGSTITTTTTPSIDDVLPYVDNVKHLVNPTLVKSGKNLLPPFTQWTRHTNTVVNSDYSLTLNANGTYQRSYVDIPCVSSTTYTVSMNATSNAQMSVEGLDSSKTSIGVLGNTNVGVFTRTITTQSNAMFLRIYIGNYTNTPGTFTFTNPQLELGSTATAFEPQNDDYIYAEATLASNIDGTVRDSLTMRDGVWRKTKLWQTDVVLDGSLNISYNSDYTGYKSVIYTLPFSCVSYQETVSKYDGKILGKFTTGSPTSGDQARTTSTSFILTISDTDSGWGETYTPSSAEVKAYFYGYKMNNGTFGTNYDGTGTKTWTLWNATSNTGAVTTVPTTLASGFTPYKLSYQLATPTQEIVNVEGDIALHSGTNQITLGEGVIVREKVVPDLASGNYWINRNLSPTASQASKRVSKLLAVYRNGQLDTRWTIETETTYSNGIQRAFTSSANFDSTAEYTVTYQALDEYVLTSNATSASIYYATNVGAAVSEAIKVVNDLNTMSDNFATKSEVSDLRNDVLLKTGGTITGTLKIQQTVEKINVVASAPTTNIDLLDGAIDYFTSNTTANFTLNFRGNASSTLNSILAVGESATVAILVTNGTTAYYANTIQIDGTTRTVKWSGGTAPTAGNASSVDSYTFSIIKTADNTFTILGSQTKYA